MFANKGYISLCRVSEGLSLLASRFERQAAEPAFEADDLDGIAYKPLISRVLFHRWLIDHAIFQMPFQLYLNSHSGQEVSIHRTVASAADHYSLKPFDWPPKIGGQLLKTLEIKSEDRFSSRYDYFFIQMPTWTVRSHIPKYLQEFSSRMYLSTPVAEVLRPFDGWSICLREDDYQPLMEHLYRATPETIRDQIDWHSKANPEETSSTPTRTSALAEFREKYGNTLDSVTLSEAARTLGYDRKTLRAALTEGKII